MDNIVLTMCFYQRASFVSGPPCCLVLIWCFYPAHPCTRHCLTTLSVPSVESLAIVCTTLSPDYPVCLGFSPTFSVPSIMVMTCASSVTRFTCALTVVRGLGIVTSVLSPEIGDFGLDVQWWINCQFLITVCFFLWKTRALSSSVSLSSTHTQFVNFRICSLFLRNWVYRFHDIRPISFSHNTLLYTHSQNKMKHMTLTQS